MSDETPTGAALSPTLPQAQELARGLGLLVYNTRQHHWFSSKDEHETLVAYYALVTGYLTHLDELVFRLVGDALSINGTAAPADERYVETLVAQMKSHEAGNFTLRRGISVEDLAEVVRLLAAEAGAAQQAGGFAAALALRGVGHVASRTIVYRELNDDDVVVSRRDLTAATAAAGMADMSSQEAQARTHLAAVATDRGEAQSGVQAVQALANDPVRLAALIVEAAQVRTTGPTGLAGELVACVRRVFDALGQDEAAHTQRGRKQLQKALRDLEQDVLKQIQASRTEDRAACEAAVHGIVEELKDDLQIDSLAIEYAKRLKAIDSTEQRLLRYLKSHGAAVLEAGELGERLREEGVGPEQWGALLIQGQAGVITADAVLSPLLNKMEQAAGELAAGADSAKAQELTRLLGEVQGQVGAMVERTAQKIRKVTADIAADAQAVAAAEAAAQRSGQGLKMTRHKLLELLAEVVQELCQPLAVIKCSVDMIQSRMLGDVPATQLEMLKLVTESTARLQGLVDGLQKVAGVPDSMSPDRELLRRVSPT